MQIKQQDDHFKENVKKLNEHAITIRNHAESIVDLKREVQLLKVQVKPICDFNSQARKQINDDIVKFASDEIEKKLKLHKDEMHAKQPPVEERK